MAANIEERIKKAIQGTEQRSGVKQLSVDEIIPEDIRTYTEKYKISKTELEKICRSMEQVIEKWNIKQRNMRMPTSDPELTLPYHCAQALERLQQVTANMPGVLNEILLAADNAYLDLAAIERDHVIDLYRTIIEKIFKHYLVNEVPVIDRAIKETMDSAALLIKMLEKAESNGSSVHKNALKEMHTSYEFTLYKMRQHLANFPDRQADFARGAHEFTKGLQAHYARIVVAIDSTLELLNDKLDRIRQQSRTVRRG